MEIMWYEVTGHNSEERYSNGYADYYQTFDTLQESRKHAQEISAKYPIVIIRKVQSREIKLR